ncbi:MAG: response regulator [Gemmatimonadaceae bacterium]|nr:response regulator [Gemmatimonadaceae bacterium]
MKKIAVVEDNPDNRLLVAALLDDRYLIIEFECGPDALVAMPLDRPDLVLLDISLPQMDGSEVLRRMKEDDRLADIPVIALTAHAGPADRDRFISEGFDDYITKPILDEQVLISAIDRLIQGKSP